ncbi:MAG: hypothetical protein ACHQU8_08770 [Gemmatimonadales bacterium]
MRRIAITLLLALGLTVVPRGAAAQGASNLYLPIDSWASPYVEHLIRSGVLRGLDPLTRPLRRADVARAVAAADTTTLSASGRSVLRLLAWELQERPDTVRWKVEGFAGAQGASDASRWTYRPQPEDNRLFWSGGVSASLEFPHVGLVTSPYFDTRLLHDAQFAGYKQRFIAGDNSEAYAIASWKYFEAFFGFESRNWGPPEAPGILLSPSPYPFDQLMIRLGPRRLRLEMIATQLDTLTMQDSSGLTNRYLSLHRLVVWPSDRLGITLSEGALTANQKGLPALSFQPWYLNPVNLWLLIDANRYAGPTKDFVAMDASYAVRNDVRVAGQLFFNDFTVDTRSATNPEKPRELGYTLSATGPALDRGATWSIFYTRVDNNVYQTQKGTQFQYSIRGVGIGRDHIDYDQLTARVTGLVAPRALIGGELTYLRQGEGDFTKPFPPLDSLTSQHYVDSLAFLTGVVERTVRVAAQVNWTPRSGINLSADVGRHFIWNANHVQGARGDRWVWRIRAEIRRRWTGGVHLPD